MWTLINRLTAREFLVGLFLGAVLVLNFERAWGLSEEITAGIIAAMIVGAGWRLANKGQ